MAKETPTASCRTGREVHVVGLGEEVGHLEERDERDATFLWKRYVFEEVELFGSWVTHRGPCVHGELPRTWRGEGALQMARRHADVGGATSAAVESSQRGCDFRIQHRRRPSQAQRAAVTDSQERPPSEPCSQPAATAPIRKFFRPQLDFTSVSRGFDIGYYPFCPFCLFRVP